MKLSMTEAYPGYENVELAFHSKIYLDGVELNMCVAADTEEGIVYCYQKDALGHLKQVDGIAEIFKLTGKVELKVPDKFKHLMK